MSMTWSMGIQTFCLELRMIPTKTESVTLGRTPTLILSTEPREIRTFDYDGIKDLDEYALGTNPIISDLYDISHPPCPRKAAHDHRGGELSRGIR